MATPKRGPTEAPAVDPDLASAAIVDAAGSPALVVETQPVDTAAIGLRTEDVVHVDSVAAAAAVLDGEAIGIVEPGPGAGALRLAEPASGFASRPVVGDREPLRRNAERLDVAARGHADILPRAGLAIDPASVPGTRLAVAATQLRRGGRTYQPGDEVPIDYRAHVELTPIGAIVAAPWSDLPEA